MKNNTPPHPCPIHPHTTHNQKRTTMNGKPAVYQNIEIII